MSDKTAIPKAAKQVKLDTVLPSATKKPRISLPIDLSESHKTRKTNIVSPIVADLPKKSVTFESKKLPKSTLSDKSRLPQVIKKKKDYLITQSFN